MEKFISLNIQIICILHEVYSQDYPSMFYQNPLIFNQRYNQPRLVEDNIYNEPNPYYRRSRYGNSRGMIDDEVEDDDDFSSEEKNMDAPRYVFIPLPYSYMFPKAIPPMLPTPSFPVDIITPTTTTTRTTITTMPPPLSEASTELAESEIPKSNENIPDESKLLMTSLRRTKPSWLPRYGIVPISNRLAEKLMTRIHKRTKDVEYRNVHKIF